MNARFAEPCRANSLAMEGFEEQVFFEAGWDGRTQKDRILKCEKDIFIGLFFDGTNNNKYRDTPGFSHSNVARLYEAYPGTPAAQTPPSLRPRVMPGGGLQERPVFPDQPFKASSVPADDYPYYRKVYVPGLGTPFPDGKDSGTGLHKTGGLAMALLGQVRLDWAMLQLVNQVHAAVFRAPLESRVDMGGLYRRGRRDDLRMPAWAASVMGIAGAAADLVQGRLQQQWESWSRAVGVYGPQAFERLLEGYVQRLGEALRQRGGSKPDLRKIRLSVFGFSRGAAKVRMAFYGGVPSRQTLQE